MIRPVIKFVVLRVFLIVLLALPVLTQVFAQTGMGGMGGGAGAGASGAGAGASGAGAGAGSAGAGAGSAGGFGGGYFYSPSPLGRPVAGAGLGGFYSTQQPGSSYARSLGTKATKKHRKAM